MFPYTVSILKWLFPDLPLLKTWTLSTVLATLQALLAIDLIESFLGEELPFPERKSTPTLSVTQG